MLPVLKHFTYIMVSYELKFSVIPAVVVTTTHSGSLNLVSSQGAIHVS